MALGGFGEEVFAQEYSVNVAYTAYTPAYTALHGILLSGLGWCPYLPLGNVRQTTKADIYDC